MGKINPGITGPIEREIKTSHDKISEAAAIKRSLDNVLGALVREVIAVVSSPYTHQNVDDVDQILIISGGTVSDIEFSVDGVTYYTTGLTSGMFFTPSGTYLKTTYSVKPTMNKFY